MTDVRVPTLGESVTEATVATWFKQPGDSINMDEMLCELETDKVTVEVPSPAAGVMGSIVAQEGSVVSMDALLTTISEGSPEKQGNEKITISIPSNVKIICTMNTCDRSIGIVDFAIKRRLSLIHISEPTRR